MTQRPLARAPLADLLEVLDGAVDRPPVMADLLNDLGTHRIVHLLATCAFGTDDGDPAHWQRLAELLRSGLQAASRSPRLETGRLAADLAAMLRDDVPARRHSVGAVLEFLLAEGDLDPILLDALAATLPPDPPTPPPPRTFGEFIVAPAPEPIPAPRSALAAARERHPDL